VVDSSSPVAGKRSWGLTRGEAKEKTWVLTREEAKEKTLYSRVEVPA